MRQESVYRNQAAQRVLAVLESFVSRVEPVSAAELVRSLGMSPNMVHRALTTLAEGGYITRDPGGKKFQLGHRVLALRNGDIDDFDITIVARPYLEALHALTNESVFLAIIVGNNRVTVDAVEAQGRRVAHSERGLAVPLHVGQTSRALLSGLSDTEIETYLRNAPPLEQYRSLFTTTANETVDDVWRDIRSVRANGYIAWSNPLQYGAVYAAYLILGASERPHAAVSIAGPHERFTVERLRDLHPAIEAALEPLRAQARLVPPAPVFFSRETL